MAAQRRHVLIGVAGFAVTFAAIIAAVPVQRTSIPMRIRAFNGRTGEPLPGPLALSAHYQPERPIRLLCRPEQTTRRQDSVLGGFATKIPLSYGRCGFRLATLVVYFPGLGRPFVFNWPVNDEWISDRPGHDTTAWFTRMRGGELQIVTVEPRYLTSFTDVPALIDTRSIALFDAEGAIRSVVEELFFSPRGSAPQFFMSPGSTGAAIELQRHPSGTFVATVDPGPALSRIEVSNPFSWIVEGAVITEGGVHRVSVQRSRPVRPGDLESRAIDRAYAELARRNLAAGNAGPYWIDRPFSVEIVASGRGEVTLRARERNVNVDYVFPRVGEDGLGSPLLVRVETSDRCAANGSTLREVAWLLDELRQTPPDQRSLCEPKEKCWLREADGTQWKLHCGETHIVERP